MSRSVSASESDAQDCIDLPDRTVRALTEYLTVTPDTGRARDVPGMALVTSQSGSEYLVDVRDGRCECGDAQHRDPHGGCKHVRRARFATGVEAIPAAASQLDVDPDLGEHCDAEVRFASADGGTDIIEAPVDGVVLEDDVDRVYTYHRESYDQGGARYVRCERCDAECVPADPDRLAHRDGCPEGRR